MKSAMLSIKPQYCELIASGKKTIELRKSRPKIETPFKCYIYECNWKNNSFYAYKHKGKLGKVIGEFVCKNISVYPYFDDGYSVSYGYVTITDKTLKKMCLDLHEIEDYGNCKKIYGWHISDLIIYDNPKELSEFRKPCPHGENISCYSCEKAGYNDFFEDSNIRCLNFLKTIPQSWYYVQEVI